MKHIKTSVAGGKVKVPATMVEVAKNLRNYKAINGKYNALPQMIDKGSS